MFLKSSNYDLTAYYCLNSYFCRKCGTRLIHSTPVSDKQSPRSYPLTLTETQTHHAHSPRMLYPSREAVSTDWTGNVRCTSGPRRPWYLSPRVLKLIRRNRDIRITVQPRRSWTSLEIWWEAPDATCLPANRLARVLSR
jgi:hypothetical protein